MMQCFRDRTNGDHFAPNELQCDRNLFEILPYEILEMLVRYLDIPSIAIMSQTSKHEHGTIAHLVSDEKIWLQLVNQRFGLFSSSRLNKASSKVEGTRMSKPKLYGGSTWKEAYRVMARCNRIPKMKVNFKKKVIFAKGNGYVTDENVVKAEAESNIPFLVHAKKMSPGSCEERLDQKQKQGHYSNQCVASWVMINHTEDCTLRSSNDIQALNCDHFDPHSNTYHTSVANHDNAATNTTRFIELQLALQNTKSGFCHVDVDVCKSTVLMKDSSGNYITQRIVGYGELGPKIIYRSANAANNHSASKNGFSRKVKRSKQQQTALYLDPANGIVSLKPLEFAIVSVCIPMTHYRERNENLRFETDFLSRSLSVSIPANIQYERQTQEKKIELSYKKKLSLVEKSHKKTANHATVIVAAFADEHEIWESYMELPGGFLTLIDKGN